MNWLQKIAMFVEGEGERVFAYRDRVFLIDPQTDLTDPVTRKAANHIGINTRELMSKYRDSWEFLSEIEGLRPDVLQGYINGSTLVISSLNFPQHTGSRLLQNVLKALELDHVEYANSEGEVYDDAAEYQITGKLPTSLYHGTSSRHAYEILRFGLRAGQSETNYPGGGYHGAIEHSEIIFLTEDISKAAYHALNAVDKQGGFPVVVQVKVPDPDLLVSDYDIEVMYDDEFEGNIYDNTYKAPISDFSPRIHEEPFSFSKKTGIFGYRGRVPASFIEAIMIQMEEDSDSTYDPANWHGVSKAELLRALDFNTPEGAYYNDYEDEEDEYSEETVYASAIQQWLKSAHIT